MRSSRCDDSVVDIARGTPAERSGAALWRDADGDDRTQSRSMLEQRPDDLTDGVVIWLSATLTEQSRDLCSGRRSVGD